MNTFSLWAAALQVAAGGATGAVLRWAAGEVVPKWLGHGTFPYATLLVNVFGSLAMGLLAGWLLRGGNGAEAWRLFLGVGVLGGFTTFSTFSLDLFLLIDRDMTSLAFLYAVTSVIAGLGALWLGMVLARSMA